MLIDLIDIILNLLDFIDVIDVLGKWRSMNELLELGVSKVLLVKVNIDININIIRFVLLFIVDLNVVSRGNCMLLLARR